MQILTNNPNNHPDGRSDCSQQARASDALSAESTGNTKLPAITIAAAVLALLLTGCASQDTREVVSKQELRTTALQRWNRCINDYTSEESASGQTLSIEESMEYCQGYKYDFLSTYPPHLSGSINRMLTDAAYRSGYRTLIKERVDPELGHLLPIDSSEHANRRMIDFIVKEAVR